VEYDDINAYQAEVVAIGSNLGGHVGNRHGVAHI
jgi:hypothetical protein